MGHGGARKGSGPKKGAKYAPTITKEQAREAARAVILKHMDRMLAANIENACGIRHLMLRNEKTGQFERVAKDTTDPKVAEAQIDGALASGNAVWIHTKDPNVSAFTDLMNRALDKPVEQLQLSGELNIQTEITKKLEAAKQRRLKRTHGSNR